MTKIVGILNLTPDSFSGDGMQLALTSVLPRIDAMIHDGASVIDIGAESTRPGARPLSAEEEWSRFAPICAAIADRKDRVRFSIDTRHSEVARNAIAAGFSWINDVSGGADPGMINMARDAGCTLALMHSLGIPADAAKTLAPNADVTEEVYSWAAKLLEQMDKQSFPSGRIILDPGIGFGKTREQSLALIRNIARLKSLGLPVMVGHSRKSFLSLFTDKKAYARDPETLAVSSYLVQQQVDYLRVHDVKSHAAMLRIQAAL